MECFTRPKTFGCLTSRSGAGAALAASDREVPKSRAIAHAVAERLPRLMPENLFMALLNVIMVSSAPFQLTTSHLSKIGLDEHSSRTEPRNLRGALSKSII